MELTGKCEADFDKWLLSTHKEDYSEFKGYTLNLFDTMPESCQFGVIQDFADLKGFEFYTKKASDLIEGYYYSYCEWWPYPLPHKTRSEAREEMIEQFNIEYNNTVK